MSDSVPMKVFIVWEEDADPYTNPTLRAIYSTREAAEAAAKPGQWVDDEDVQSGDAEPT